MRYIQGEDRAQKVLFPESIDDYITDNNPVRFIDAFVDSLDMKELGFAHAETKDTGRKPYAPSDMLKLYIYGYTNRVRSSRLLEKLTHQNIEAIWLLRKLHPDFKTIADFRKDNPQAIINVFTEFLKVCKRLGVLGTDLIAVDGSKFRAQNSKGRNLSKNQVKRLLKKAEEQALEYLEQLNENDKDERPGKEMSKEGLESKIDSLQKESVKYKKYLNDMDKSGDKQISETDPDSRKMKARPGKQVSYNAQIAVDGESKMIVANDVCNECNDLNQLYNMGTLAKEMLGKEKLNLVADKGYYNPREIARCSNAGIDSYVPGPNLSKRLPNGMFSVKDFKYDKTKDSYICPSGQTLDYWADSYFDKKLYKIYKTKHCKGCDIRENCTTSRAGRRIKRWAKQGVLDELNRNAEFKKEVIAKRKGIVEHPFGTLKRSMGYEHFLCKGLENVKAEFSLAALAYNIKRFLNIIDFNQFFEYFANFLHLKSIVLVRLTLFKAY